jgi:hypothetical protein
LNPTADPKPPQIKDDGKAAEIGREGTVTTNPPTDPATREPKPCVAEPVSTKPPPPSSAPGNVVSIDTVRDRKAQTETKRSQSRKRIYPRKCPPSIARNYEWNAPTKKAGWSLSWRTRIGKERKNRSRYICYLRYHEWDEIKLAHKTTSQRILALRARVASKIKGRKKSGRLSALW